MGAGSGAGNIDRKRAICTADILHLAAIILFFVPPTFFIRLPSFYFLTAIILFLYRPHSSISLFLRLCFVPPSFLYKHAIILLPSFFFLPSFFVFHRNTTSLYVGWSMYRHHSSTSFLRFVFVPTSFSDIILKVGTCTNSPTSFSNVIIFCCDIIVP